MIQAKFLDANRAAVAEELRKMKAEAAAADRARAAAVAAESSARAGREEAKTQAERILAGRFGLTYLKLSSFWNDRVCEGLEMAGRG